jgi:hypothetical protein
VVSFDILFSKGGAGREIWGPIERGRGVDQGRRRGGGGVDQGQGQGVHRRCPSSSSSSSSSSSKRSL